MSDKVFLDTNVLLYAYSEDELTKQEVALKLLEMHESYSYISTQVINELSNILLKKFKLSTGEVENALLEIDDVTIVLSFDLKTQIKALKLKNRYRFQYYDALIVATALENNCTILYSEDMQHQQLIENRLTIINPFVA
jgi:predicted nucleic acid-binding protein